MKSRPSFAPEPARSLLPASLLFAIVLAVCSIHAAQSTASPTVAITGKVIGASGSHPVYVALWDASGFLAHPVQQVRFDPGVAPAFRFRVLPGRWAVSAFEDENGNGVLDMGRFGPKEPSGFWRPFHGWRKPRFDDVSVEIDRDTSDADIRLSR
jgi:uncharacterized protein (DUF2141 family)